MTVLITIYLARRVVRPVRRTAMMAERLAAGALDARVPATSTAEVGVLERAFNSMAESLQHHVGELARLSDEQAALRRRCIAGYRRRVAHSANGSRNENFRRPALGKYPELGVCGAKGTRTPGE